MESVKTVLDVITLEQLRELRTCGFVVVHQVPTYSMQRAATRNEWPEQLSMTDIWNRMVAESIRIQKVDLA